MEKPCVLEENKDKKPKKQSIEELFSGYQGEYVSEEVDWGKPVGKEI